MIQENERIKNGLGALKKEAMDLQNKAEQNEEDDYDAIEDGIRIKQLEASLKER